MHSQAPKRALQCAARARCFTTSSKVAAVSPYRAAKATTVTESKKRDQSTAAAPSVQRATPSPAFNRTETSYKDVQPLQPYKQPEMDHSFVGKNGGEIFHEMMLRHGVKHVCMLIVDMMHESSLGPNFE